MQGDRQPSRPIDVYKAIIDQFVQISHGVSEKLILEHGVWSKASGEEAASTFVRSLTGEQRRTLATMLHQERTGAIHDVLAALTWWILTRDVGLTFRGESLPIELSGQGLHGDYIGRLNDWPWPKDNSTSDA